MRSSLLVALTLGLVAAIALGGAASAQPSRAEKSGVALTVSPQGNDGACARGRPQQPCASFNRAYALARCRDVIEVKAGSYGDQDIADTSRNCADRARVVIRAQRGTQPVVRKIQLGTSGGNWSYSNNGPDDLRLSGFKLTWGLEIYSNAANIVAERMDGGSFLVAGNIRDQREGPNRITIRNSDWGPCTPSGSFRGQFAGCRTVFEDRPSGEGQNQIAHGAKNVLIEHNTVHDFVIDVPGAHWECFWVNGGHNITWRANKLWNCETTVWSIGEHSGARLTGTWYIENNWVGRSINDGTSLNFTQPPYNGNVVVRFNSFGPMQASGTEEGSPDSGTVHYVGNIFGQGICTPGARYSYNLFVARGGRAMCTGIGNRRITAISYVNPDRFQAMNYHLSRRSIADRFVPPSAPFSNLRRDYDGQRRTSFRTAGSDERRGAQR